jgi:TolB protein
MQTFYTVGPGDTLYSIARRWEIPVESLIAANNLGPPYTIYSGQQLSVPPGVDVYRVKSGDSIYRISQIFGVTPEVIIQANQLQVPYTIQVGQLLKVPIGIQYYVVQPGDTLYQIARRFNVSTLGQNQYQLIRDINNLSFDTIFPGMKLIIPYAPTGDLGLIAYISNQGGNYDLWIYNPRNGKNTQLTNGLGESYSIPYWSPDSKKIAFIGNYGILYVVMLAETTMAKIDQFADGLGVFLNWSPNSQSLVYSKANTITVYNVITHQVQRINQSNTTDVQWFPNGEELLFQQPDASGFSQLYRIRIDGTAKQQLTQNSAGPLNTVRLSPNGLFVLYTTPGVSISLIYTIDLTTGNTFEVRGGPLAKNYYPVWSPDSSTIAYSGTAFEEVGYFSLIRTSGIQGEGDRTRAISDCFSTPVTWSPNGQKLAYLSGCKNQGTANEIWILELKHPVPIRVVAGGSIIALQWSPTEVTPLKRTFRNTVYNVQFQYPAHWERVNEERYEGPDGFFQISAISSDDAIEKVCQNEAYQQLLPYGTQPRIVHTYIENQVACLITPSQDQAAEMRGQAALIVRYPTPVIIEGTPYNYFILWADQGHIREISQSLTFLSLLYRRNFQY